MFWASGLDRYLCLPPFPFQPEGRRHMKREGGLYVTNDPSLAPSKLVSRVFQPVWHGGTATASVCHRCPLLPPPSFPSPPPRRASCVMSHICAAFARPTLSPLGRK